MDRGAKVFEALCVTLTGQSKPVVLVLDDLHLVAEPEDRVSDLLAHAPPAGLKIIGATRTADTWYQRIPRAIDQKLLTPDDLRFDPVECANLLRLSGMLYDVRSPEIITRECEGLAALVHAVCSSVPASELAEPENLTEHVRAAIDRFLDRTLRRDTELAAHRGAVILSSAAYPLTRSATAVLDEVGDADGFLNLLERSGLTTVTERVTESEWQFPRPVRRSLLRLAATEAPQRLREVRLALVRHWLDLEQPNLALKHAADAEDWPLAVEILHAHLDVLYTRDYPTTMDDQVLARIPESLVENDSTLRALREMHHQFASPRDNPGTMPVVESPSGTGADPVDVMIHAVALRIDGRFAESAETFDPLARGPVPELEKLTQDDRDSRGFVYVHMGISYLLAGRFLDAIVVLRRAHRIADDFFVRRDAAGKLALAHVLLGDPDEAQTWTEEERRHPSLPAATELLVRPAGDVAAALTALDRLDIDTATDILHSLGPPDDREEFWGFVLFAHGRLALATGTPANGLRYIEKESLRFTAMRDNGAVVAPLLDSVCADLHLACGRPEEATALVGASTDVMTAPARARIRLLTDDPVAAAEIAREAVSDVRNTSRDAIELELVNATAALAAGDRAQATQCLNKALVLSRMAGLPGPFASLPRQVLTQLASLGQALPVEAGSIGSAASDFGVLTFPTTPEAGHLVNASHDGLSSEGSVANGAAPARPGLPDQPHTPLTERELAVLGDLATGATIRQIASRNFLSVNTIKSQMRSVYRKLGTNSRETTLEVATRLRLL